VFRQIAASFRLEQSHQISDHDENLILGPLLRRQATSIALGGQFLNPTPGGGIGPESQDFSC
jgi:hypothetical protein